MAKRNANLIFVGISGTVLALDKSRGTEVWRTKLSGSEFVNVVIESDNIYATTKGEMFCLDPKSGGLRWKNPLKGLGYGLVTIAGPGGQNTTIAEQANQDEGENAAVMISASS